MSNPLTFKNILTLLVTGEPLSRDQAERAFEIIMSGEATDAQIGAFVMALQVRGEALDEIIAGVSVLRQKSMKVDAPAGVIDTCGTGGDASGTYNISTAASFLVAGAGVLVAKHGNRAMTSKSGAADVLAALGVNVEATPEIVRQCINEAGIGFMFAQMHHSAMRHVAGPRTELGFRSILNLIGPMSNPAGAKRQLLGVFARQWIRPMAEVLGALGAEHVWCVHGSDGLDELTTTGISYVAEYKDGKIREFEVSPEEFGLSLASPDDLRGGSAAVNAKAITDLLAGKTSAYRDIVILNAGAAMVIAGAAEDVAAGMEMATASLDDGRAAQALRKLVVTSNAAAEQV